MIPAVMPITHYLDDYQVAFEEFELSRGNNPGKWDDPRYFEAFEEYLRENHGIDTYDNTK